ncbi:MAG: branched-chain amino acid ABC transporter permease [Spirochaetia bacterium]|jgi:branched-chain amino acid transport system permease protein|nr:branched-chain amino acid ABC transporter permease [Spirochaetia bacterium]
MEDIKWKEYLKNSFISMIWFSLLLFPMLVMKITVKGGMADVTYRWGYMVIVPVAAFILSALWKYFRERQQGRESNEKRGEIAAFFRKAFIENKKIQITSIILAILIMAFYPVFSGMYNTNVMISALIYIMLGLGLNIVLGLGGMLHLGHAAFFAVGAYTYGLFFRYAEQFFINAGISTGWMFWIALPAGGLMAAVFGVLLSLPVLRLRGDYLAIVTLAFGEITRMVLQNWGSVTGGATGISLIPRPWFFGVNVTPKLAAIYIYYIVFAFVIISIITVSRLENSRIGRAWEAMREDEIACQSMGIDLVRNKLTAFVLGSVWAGVAGVLFASQTTYINPDSFTIWESILILCIVVLGGTGSISGVILGALIIKLLPEYMRAFAQYRMLIFGLALVLMMIFRPGGIIKKVRKVYRFPLDEVNDTAAEGQN